MLHMIGMVEKHIRNSQGSQDILGDGAAFRLPRVALAELASITDEHQQRDAIQLSARHDGVDRCEKPMVLHQQRRLHTGEMGASRDPDALFFFRESNERHVGVVLSETDQMDEPGLRQRRHQTDAACLERIENEL